tara:strand:+ start:1181 stop:1675 length:495 start_codon:yes stop_codon:yes gene_type:complete
MKLADLQFEAKKPKQVKASDKKPKLIKPNKGNESPHPMRGKLVGEANNKKPELPKQNNPVAKHSRNMAGAGAHKSPKDYDRKKSKQDIKKQIDESPYVVSKVEAVSTALDRTKDWLQSLWSKNGNAQLEAIKELGVLAGFTAEKRSENNVVFQRFFTQTENDKR